MADETQQPSTGGDTTIFEQKDSKIGNVSVRALIAFTLVVTVCLMCIIDTAADIIISFNAKTLPTFEIKEPLYSGFMVAIGAYLGKQLANGGKK